MKAEIKKLDRCSACHGTGIVNYLASCAATSMDQKVCPICCGSRMHPEAAVRRIKELEFENTGLRSSLEWFQQRAEDLKALCMQVPITPPTWYTAPRGEETDEKS